MKSEVCHSASRHMDLVWHLTVVKGDGCERHDCGFEDLCCVGIPLSYRFSVFGSGGGSSVLSLKLMT